MYSFRSELNEKMNTIIKWYFILFKFIFILSYNKNICNKIVNAQSNKIKIIINNVVVIYEPLNFLTQLIVKDDIACSI